jgi:hypothetical protein
MQTTLTSPWSQSQHDGWLACLYGTPQPDGTRLLPPSSPQALLITLIDRLIAFTLTPCEAAIQSAALLMSGRDLPFANLTGLVLRAAESHSEERVLQCLVEYLVALGSLPVPDGVEIADAQSWRDLPGLNIGLTESLQGATSPFVSSTSISIGADIESTRVNLPQVPRRTCTASAVLRAWMKLRENGQTLIPSLLF